MVRRCFGETAVPKRPRFALETRLEPTAKQSCPPQGIVQQWVSGPGGTRGERKGETLAGRERPPRKRPSHAQLDLSGRSLLGFFLAGRPRGRGGDGGVRRSRPDRHAPISCSAIRVDIQALCSPKMRGSRGISAQRSQFDLRDVEPAPVRRLAVDFRPVRQLGGTPICRLHTSHPGRIF